MQVRQGRRETAETMHFQPGLPNAVRVPWTLGVVPDQDPVGVEVLDGRERAGDAGSTIDADDVELPSGLRQRIDVPCEVEIVLTLATRSNLGISGGCGRCLDEPDGARDACVDQCAAHDACEELIMFHAVHRGASSPQPDRARARSELEDSRAAREVTKMLLNGVDSTVGPPWDVEFHEVVHVVDRIQSSPVREHSPGLRVIGVVEAAEKTGPNRSGPGGPGALDVAGPQNLSRCSHEVLLSAVGAEASVRRHPMRDGSAIAIPQFVKRLFAVQWQQASVLGCGIGEALRGSPSVF